MSNHTPEPWVYSFPKINGEYFRETDCQISTGGFLIANVSHGPIFPAEPFGSQARESNARRIVACVNACKGLGTEDLERNGVIAASSDYFSKLKWQRDELLEALELAVEQMESDTIQIECEWGCGRDLDELNDAGELPEAILKARASISKAKGGAA